MRRLLARLSVRALQCHLTAVTRRQRSCGASSHTPVAVVVHLVGAAVEDVDGVVCEVVGVCVRAGQHTHHHPILLRGSLVHDACRQGRRGDTAAEDWWCVAQQCAQCARVAVASNQRHAVHTCNSTSDSRCAHKCEASRCGAAMHTCVLLPPALWECHGLHVSVRHTNGQGVSRPQVPAAHNPSFLRQLPSGSRGPKHTYRQSRRPKHT